jgi:hypothetical protein
MGNFFTCIHPASVAEFHMGREVVFASTSTSQRKSLYTRLVKVTFVAFREDTIAKHIGKF